MNEVLVTTDLTEVAYFSKTGSKVGGSCPSIAAVIKKQVIKKQLIQVTALVASEHQ